MLAKIKTFIKKEVVFDVKNFFFIITDCNF